MDIVVVATTNDALAEVTPAALDAGKHVLVEKPAAANVAELEPLLAAARARASRVRVGFNHRYHPALQKAREIVDSGALGAADVRPRPLRPRRARRLRQGVARRSRPCPAAAS